MEKRTMGALMAALRKSKGMTQQDVAEKIGISNKTVSKWECNDGYPDITMLPVIAEIFGITVDELLKGEIRNEEKEEKAFSYEKGIKQIEFMIASSYMKFKSFSVIAVGLSVFSPIIGFIMQNIFNDYLLSRTASLIALCVSFIFAAAGIVIEWYAANKLTFSFSSDDAQKCENRLISYLKSARNYIALVLCFAIFGVLKGIASYIYVY
ncbi:MAG: helix-turn-helix domain-containing protein, partial [Oscillospiraceae bacterium]|nr:helix-turn-helix domain-containing protein [Oscillospiraceae bacterium]